MSSESIVIIGTVLFMALTIFILTMVLMHQKKMALEKEKIKDLKIQLQKNSIEAIIEAQELESEKIAKNIHDELGALLMAAKMNNYNVLDAVKSEEAKEVILKNDNLLKDISENVRSISHNLLPPPLRRGEVNEALYDLFDSLSNDELKFSIRDSDLWSRINKEDQLSIYRVINEWALNLIKYSKASNVSLSIHKNNNALSIELVDNGVHFDYQKALQDSKGHGLKSIHGRLEKADFDYFYLQNKEGLNVFRMNQKKAS